MDKMQVIENEIKDGLTKDHVKFNQGDIIKVFYKIRDKEKERIQPLEGIVLKTQGALHRKTFTIRRLSFGSSYEVTFPMFSPNIDKIQITKASRRKARRAKIYYVRGRIGKKAFIA